MEISRLIHHNPPATLPAVAPSSEPAAPSAPEMQRREIPAGMPARTSKRVPRAATGKKAGPYETALPWRFDSGSVSNAPSLPTGPNFPGDRDVLGQRELDELVEKIRSVPPRAHPYALPYGKRIVAAAPELMTLKYDERIRVITGATRIKRHHAKENPAFWDMTNEEKALSTRFERESESGEVFTRRVHAELSKEAHPDLMRAVAIATAFSRSEVKGLLKETVEVKDLLLEIENRVPRWQDEDPVDYALRVARSGLQSLDETNNSTYFAVMQRLSGLEYHMMHTDFRFRLPREPLWIGNAVKHLREKHPPSNKGSLSLPKLAARMYQTASDDNGKIFGPGGHFILKILSLSAGVAENLLKKEPQLCHLETWRDERARCADDLREKVVRELRESNKDYASRLFHDPRIAHLSPSDRRAVAHDVSDFWLPADPKEDASYRQEPLVPVTEAL